MDTQPIIQAEARYWALTHQHQAVIIIRREGSHRFEGEGRRYIDLATVVPDEIEVGIEIPTAIWNALGRANED